MLVPIPMDPWNTQRQYYPHLFRGFIPATPTRHACATILCSPTVALKHPNPSQDHLVHSLNGSKTCVATATWICDSYRSISTLKPTYDKTKSGTSETYPKTPMSTNNCTSVVGSLDLVPLVFSFLPPSSFVACSFVSTLWELCSRQYIYGHITTVDGLSFSQCIALFTGSRQLASYVRSCCFRYSMVPSPYIDEDICLFIQYVLSTCTNLLAISFWKVPLHSDAVSLLHQHNTLHVLTFQECSWDYTTLSTIILSSTHIKLLQITNTRLFRNDWLYHQANLHSWSNSWGSHVSLSLKPRPFSVLIHSPQHKLMDAFWELLTVGLDLSDLKHLKLVPHMADVNAANMFLAACLPSITHLEASIIGKVTSTYVRLYLLNTCRTNTTWISASTDQPAA